MSPQEDIQENPAAHGIDNLGVGRPLGEVKQLDRASTLTLKLGPLALGFGVIGARRTFDGRIYLARGSLVVILVFVFVSVSPYGVRAVV